MSNNNRALYHNFIGNPADNAAKMKRLELNREVVQRQAGLSKLIETAERQLAGVENRLAKRRENLEAKMALPKATGAVKERLSESLELAEFAAEAEMARLKAQIADHRLHLESFKVV